MRDDKFFTRINAKLRKANSKMISILNHCGLRNSTFAKQLKKENKTNTFED